MAIFAATLVVSTLLISPLSNASYSLTIAMVITIATMYNLWHVSSIGWNEASVPVPSETPKNKGLEFSYIVPKRETFSAGPIVD
jgi:hypothetical protein